MDADDATRLIRAHLPLAADHVRPLGAGFHSAGFVVDGAWTVRVTRADSDDVDREARLLTLVGEAVAVPVPRLMHVARPDGGPVLTAYPLIEGEPLTATAPAGPAREVALDQLAGLLRDLAAIPADEARAAGAGQLWRPPPIEPVRGAAGPDAGGPPPDGSADAEADAEGPRPNGPADAADEIGPPPIPDVLDAELAATVRAELEAWADGPEATVEPVLVHGDLKPEHVRHDPATGALTGVLDWGKAQLGHPLHDLAVVGHLIGRDVRDAIAARLPAAGAARVDAVARHVLTLRWLDAIAEFAADGRDEWVRRSVADLREHLASPA